MQPWLTANSKHEIRNANNRHQNKNFNQHVAVRVLNRCAFRSDIVSDFAHVRQSSRRQLLLKHYRPEDSTFYSGTSPVELKHIVSYLDHYLTIAEYSDDSVNGLQVENRGGVTKIGLSVDACLEAIEVNAAGDRGA